MKLSIDRLNSITGWTATSPNTIDTRTNPKYIAGLDNTASLILYFDKDAPTKVITKTLSGPVDVSDYDTLIFSVWSQNKSIYQYSKASDFNYKIKLNDTDEFYFPVHQPFDSIDIGIEDVDTITKIEITPLFTDEDDYLIISEMVAEKEEIPYDILIATKEAVESYLVNEISDGIAVATITGSTDDTEITLSGDKDYIDRYAVVKIDDGVNTEIHQLTDNDGDTYQLGDINDGTALLNDYASANVKIQFPVYINPDYRDVRLPGIALWGIDSTPILRGGKLERVTDTYSVNNANFKERYEPEILEYNILIDCEARQQYLIDIMTRAVRKLIGSEILWINGRKHDVGYSGGPPVEQRPTTGIDLIPKIQYSMKVEVKENIFDRTTVPKTGTVTVNVDIT